MKDTIRELFEVIEQRKCDKIEGSYTCYLFEKGLDKILKKCGEECTETVIAAKNGNKEEVVAEVCDLAYHLLVLLAHQNISLDSVEEELSNRLQKQKNLKVMKNTDKNS